ncbi:universal stress protein [Dyadobacter sp. NIV53]|uniref:universal stress protein n=1 Tax=Dyadobacter sp. NIV53 TaxID=2861765 RepID=UPI001C86B994|nr:universal stress protein [Dyadobacter sp. NIV53]
MNRILIPIDFSENADRALSAAKIMADKETTELLILHAYQPYIADVSATSGSVLPGVGSPDFLSMTTELEEEFRKKLDEYADAVTAEGYKTTTIWSIGGIQSSVEEAVKEHNPDLIVLGRTGTGGFLDKLIGSSATHIALHSPCPVMIIPPQSTPKKFSKVVYATQFEYEENDILKEVYVMLNHLGGKLTLLKINTDSQPNIQSDEQYITQIKNEFDIRDENIVTREAKHVLDGIEDYCDEVNADLLIMSSRERSFLEEYLINPGVTKKLVVDTHVPLLVFHLK